MVTFVDARGCRHSTEVHAETVLEAAAMGVKVIRETEALDDASIFDLTVELVTTTRHNVQWTKVQSWLESTAPDPKTQARKARLR